MKWKVLFLLDIFLAGCVFVTPAKAEENYNYLVIVTKAANHGYTSSAIYDLQSSLTKATGTDFKLIFSDSAYSTGIQIKLLGAADSTFDKRLDRNNPDAFMIQSDGKHALRISSFTDRGLSEGIYTYLDGLGFRWFHPGDEWTHIPKLKTVEIIRDEAVVPDFSMRNYFGSFGTPRNYEVDPSKKVDKAWAQWAYRNRMAGGLKGHAGNEFLWRNIQELLQHPEYMAEINGARVKPNTAMKFCISNKGFQQLFVKDMVAQLKTVGNIISVEPSDGEGDCQCDECKKMGSISNRYFFLANLVAKEFQKISPNDYVNLYAYNTHAAPPDFDLEPNVLVQIIPYGFQYFSSPEQMIDAWKKKNHDLYIYDYYGLPITNLDKPLKDGLKPQEFAKRLQYWYSKNIKGATLESSYSIGSTGLGLYLFAKMTWSIHSDANQLVDEYYQFNYGKAGDLVKQAQQILSTDTLQNASALTMAAHLIKHKAHSLSLDERQQTCLSDYKAYMVYLKLLYDVQTGGAKNEPAASDTLMRYAYSIFQTMMVHQPPLSEYLRANGPAANYIMQNWDYLHSDKKGMKFTTIKQYTSAETDAMFDKTFD